MTMFTRTLTRADTLAAGVAIAAAGPLAASAAADPGEGAGTVSAGAVGAAGSGDVLGLGSAIGSVGPLGKVDTGSLGIGKNAAGLEIVQNDGKMMKLKVHNPKGFTGVCTPAMADAAQSVKLISDPAALLKGGPGITLFTPPIPLISSTWNSIGYPKDGIHTLAVICLGVGDADLSVTVLPVPGTTMGSVEGMVDFGSVVGGAMLGSLGDSSGS